MSYVIKHTLFLKWWLFVTIIAVGFVFAGFQGFVETIWEQDSTKLSFLLLVIFIKMSAWCGYKTWTLSRFIDEKKEDKHIVEKIEHLMEVGWFTSDLCLTIGMIGTVIGFIMMLSGFTTVDTADAKTVQDLIKTLGVGMSTALYTTLMGLICSAGLKVQYFNLSQAIDKVRE
jgi:ABC-type Fe3+ transport system permease subunit|tara:strand:- start:12760 stop:13275 length:516 start_codon:yes stop_codon:yes gene_type:complete